MKAVKIILIVLVALWLFGLGLDALDRAGTPQLSQQAIDNTNRNARRAEFVEGCVEENASTSACECAFRELGEYYGYAWYSDEELLNRILSEGYNYEEIQAVTTCKEEA